MAIDAAISYISCAALSYYNFPYVNVITLLQLMCSCFLLYVMRQRRLIVFTNDGNLRAFDNPIIIVPFETLVQTLPLALTYLLFMLVSMESVRVINVPLYTTLRRTTLGFTMVAEYIVARQTRSHRVVGSVAIIILGAFVAGARDLSFDFYSYGVVLLRNIFNAVNLTLITPLGQLTGLNPFSLMWCNGIICGPILLLSTFIQGDLQKLMSFPHLSSPGFQATMLLSCIMAFLLNYTLVWNTTVNSALTQAVCGNLKDVFTFGLGWVLFGGLSFDLLNIVGQATSFLGCCFYAYCRLYGM